MRAHFSSMRLRIQELDSNSHKNTEPNDQIIKSITEELEFYKEREHNYEEERRGLSTQISSLQETIFSQNQTIAELQELLLKKQGINTDLPNESVAASQIVCQNSNESLEAYLFNNNNEEK